MKLGKLGTDEDDALNRVFDEAIEKAFLPCREYYGEQDKLRAENALLAKTIIDELIALHTHENTATLGRALSAINKNGVRWAISSKGTAVSYKKHI